MDIYTYFIVKYYTYIPTYLPCIELADVYYGWCEVFHKLLKR